MSFRSKIILILSIAACILFLIGGLFMMKKIVKQDSIDISNIENIILNVNDADVRITITDDNELKITQYSIKKVDDSFAFTEKFDGSNLVINDNSKKVTWLLGLQGAGGISYELQIPKNYVQALSVNIENGNIDYKGQSDYFLQSFNANVKGSGDITMSSLGLLSDSSIITNAGNIDISILPQISCQVKGSANAGNMNIREEFRDGDINLTVTTNKGNLVVK